MDVNDINKRLGAIIQVQDDDETAHGLEDDLYVDFIEFVSQRKDAIGLLAKQVLKARKVKFSRWTA